MYGAFRALNRMGSDVDLSDDLDWLAEQIGGQMKLRAYKNFHGSAYEFPRPALNGRYRFGDWHYSLKPRLRNFEDRTLAPVLHKELRRMVSDPTATDVIESWAALVAGTEHVHGGIVTTARRNCEHFDITRRWAILALEMVPVPLSRSKSEVADILAALSFLDGEGRRGGDCERILQEAALDPGDLFTALILWEWLPVGFIHGWSDPENDYTFYVPPRVKLYYQSLKHALESESKDLRRFASFHSFAFLFGEPYDEKRRQIVEDFKAAGPFKDDWLYLSHECSGQYYTPAFKDMYDETILSDNFYSDYVGGELNDVQAAIMEKFALQIVSEHLEQHISE